ncbi:MAG TPA: type II toxin-antitoxin system Phd/YefM family antitoxin [Janthinobacterium sp.]|nr:type II toxin-antitoxin system Phd/YefM family antitoxin [Janthinobacterium sp.]
MSDNQVSKSEFKSKALEFFRQVEASGQSVIVTDHGKPTVEVRPYRDAGRKPLDVLRGSVVRYDGPTEPVAADDWAAAS